MISKPLYGQQNVEQKNCFPFQLKMQELCRIKMGWIQTIGTIISFSAIMIAAVICVLLGGGEGKKKKLYTYIYDIKEKF